MSGKEDDTGDGDANDETTCVMVRFNSGMLNQHSLTTRLRAQMAWTDASLSTPPKILLSTQLSILKVETHFNSLTESSLWWTPEFQRKIDSLLSSVVVWSDGSLIEIRTRHCSDFALNFVAERCPKLEVLSIKSCPNVTDRSMIQIALKCAKLRELDLSYCYEISHEALPNDWEELPYY